MKAFAVGTRVAVLTFVSLCLSEVARSQEPQWIWSPSHTKNEVPVGNCYFRKSFDLKTPELGEVQITADNRFELFVNEQPIGRSEDWRQMQVYDISKHLRPGRNCIAVKVTNVDAGSAGLVARVLVKESGNTFVSYSTNRSWKTSVRNYQSWSNPDFPDREWVNAKSYGQLNATLPWGDEVVFAGEGSRFKIGKEFAVERLMTDDEVGSLIAMAFDSMGNILASREGGHLLILTDTDGNGAHDSVDTFCDQIKNVQGILSLNTNIFAIGDGPEGVALYRLTDANRDGTAEAIKALVPIRGSRGEHGAHAVRLGPDGMLYVIIGDHARVGAQPGPQSPYRNAYEGDLVKPRYEDPRGHAVGIPAPGGTIFRTDTEGSFVELVAGGLRNSYDFAFNAEGELFTYDADMEWDMGAPWYRPTRVNHVSAGAELGWRSGWAKWPSYYLDSLPAAINLGAGSPTGVEFYNHDAFPERYRGAMFGCDWATGKIHCVRFERGGASYTATDEVFVEGRPLNATDIAVGPDGALYFCTGGRGTDGGVYRIRWTRSNSKAGQPSDKRLTTLEDALAQPQIGADWAKARVAYVKQALGQRWDLQLPTIATSNKRPLEQRLKALDLLIAFGPQPSEALLTQLASDPAVELRIRAARLLFAHRTTSSRDTLVSMLDDAEPFVRRVACESLTRFGSPAPPATFVKLLDDDSRFVAFAARRALEQLPLANWAQLVLKDPSPTVFARGSAAILAASPNAQAAQAILPRCEQLIANAPTADASAESYRVRLDLLRVAQLAFELGKLPPQQGASLGSTLLAQYPSGNDPIDRELVRLLVYLQVPGAAEKFSTQMLREDLADLEKIHLGAYAGRLKSGWSTESKQAFLKFYEVARAVPGGYSVSAYLENFARDFFAQMTPAEARQIITTGETWPTSALSLLATLPANPGSDLLAELRQLDTRVKPLCSKSDTYRRLRVGILAVLGRSGEPASLAHLRDIYAQEPPQRTTVAMTLAQHPQGENWAYLVDSIKTVEGVAAQEVLRALATVGERPRQPEPFRQVILLGLRLGDNGAPLALQLLDHWSGQQSQPSSDWKAKLAGWQQWYAQHFPGAPPAELPVDSGSDKWSYDELVAFLRTRSGRAGDRQRGEAAYAKADCAKCHRCNGQGETIGPDLTTIAQRFQQQELLESIVYPSHNISDQYASKVVTSNGRTFTGMAVPRGDIGFTMLLSDGQKVDLNHADIDDIQVSRVSVMPTGLLNKLSLSEVADLFAFLENRSGGELARKPSPTKR